MSRFIPGSRGYPQDLRPADLPRLELAQGLVRRLERKLLRLGPDGDLGCQGQELPHVASGHVGDALDLLLQPEVAGIVKAEESVLVPLLLADGVDDQPSF